MVICVPGSPIDCAVTIPTASKGSTLARETPLAAAETIFLACAGVNFALPRERTPSARFSIKRSVSCISSDPAALAKATKMGSSSLISRRICAILASTSYACKARSRCAPRRIAFRRRTTVVVAEPESPPPALPN